jgi:hypothetical protein
MQTTPAFSTQVGFESPPPPFAREVFDLSPTRNPKLLRCHRSQPTPVHPVPRSVSDPVACTQALPSFGAKYAATYVPTLLHRVPLQLQPGATHRRLDSLWTQRLHASVVFLHEVRVPEFDIVVLCSQWHGRNGRCGGCFGPPRCARERASSNCHRLL